MPKRSKKDLSLDSSSDDDDAIYKKMKKLQKKLKKLDERERYLATTSSALSEDPLSSPYLSGETFDYKSDVRAGTLIPSTLQSEDSGGRSDSQALDPTILALLGDERPSQETLGPSLHKNLAAAWTRFVRNGLSEEERKKIMTKYPPPENCTIITGPKVNPEVDQAVTRQTFYRDLRLLDNQNQMGAALSALGRLITHNLSEEGGGNLYCLELASEASKLLLDLQYKQTMTRRKLMSLNFHQELKDALEDTQSDDYLYGYYLSESARKELDMIKNISNGRKKVAIKPTYY